MKRVGNLWGKLISDENLALAIKEVNASHHYVGPRQHRRVNATTLWVERTKEDRIRELREILQYGFKSSPMRHFQIYDSNAKKTREIYEPKQWPDQYIHHALQQVLEPVMMRGMDDWCCGSIRGRGASKVIKGMKHWLQDEKRSRTKYAAECDIKKFYDSIDPVTVMNRMHHLVKDARVLDVVWAVIQDGVKIGNFCSQWFANTLLQPLDVMIRQSGLCTHYVRYMDNITLLGSNKRKLHRLVAKIADWLSTIGLRLKENHQVFPVDARMVCAVGYRFDHKKTYIRKMSALRIRRVVRQLKRKIAEGRKISFDMAAGFLSRRGQLSWCDSHRMVRQMYEKGFVRRVKDVVRAYNRKVGDECKWNSIALAAVC